MRFLNIGPLEFLFILLVALIVLGPGRMVTYARDFGRMVAKVTRSSWWRSFLETSQEIQDFKRTIMREANLNQTQWSDAEPPRPVTPVEATRPKWVDTTDPNHMPD